MSRQRFQTLPRLHVPYPDAFVELRKKQWRFGRGNAGQFRPLPATTPHPPRRAAGTHRARHDEVGLGVEVAAEDVVAVAFQGFQTLSLKVREGTAKWIDGNA